jgi:4a-hydroxytetrahydrobiopterin dehydratase
MAANLASERCVQFEKGTPPLSADEARSLLSELGPDWQLADDERALTRQMRFKNFVQAMEFLNKLAQVAEEQNHHPDFCLHRWNRVTVSLSTHSVGGVSRNDFILAAKLQALRDTPASR